MKNSTCQPSSVSSGDHAFLSDSNRDDGRERRYSVQYCMSVLSTGEYTLRRTRVRRIYRYSRSCTSTGILYILYEYRNLTVYTCTYCTCTYYIILVWHSAIQYTYDTCFKIQLRPVYRYSSTRTYLYCTSSTSRRLRTSIYRVPVYCIQVRTTVRVYVKYTTTRTSIYR